MRFAAPLAALATFATTLTGVVGLPASTATADTLVSSSRLPSSANEALATDYAVPGTSIFVATDGADTNAGTQDAPFATLAKATKAVKANGTIVVRGGVYHQGASAATGFNTGGTYYTVGLPSGVTIQAFPGETVWFDGTQQVTNWKRVSRNHYKVSWSTPDFCAQRYYERKPSRQTASGPCSYPDSIGGSSSLGDPQMAFRNGTQLTQVRSLSRMTSSSKFYYDWSKKVLHIRFNPAGSTVELTRFAQALALFKADHISIKGIGFRRYASNQFGNATAGAVLVNQGSDVLFERTAFTENAGIGMHSWQTARLTVRESILSGNGFNGLGFDGAWIDRAKGSTADDDLVIEYSRLDDNNRDRYGVNCTYACGAAGAKVSGASGITLRYNSFSRNGGARGSGFWCDLNCRGLSAYGNSFIDNARHGMIYEISEDGVIASNLFVRNGWMSAADGGGYGLYVGSARVRVYNNTLVDNKRGVSVYDDSRSAVSNTGGASANQIGSNSAGVDFVNNIVAGGSSSIGRQVNISGADLRYDGNTTATALINELSHNSYYNPAGGSRHWLVWTEYRGAKDEFFSTVADLLSKKGKETASELTTVGGNPYFTDPATGDYSVRFGSSANGSAEELPADIATLLGVPVGGHDRGVITLHD